MSYSINAWQAQDPFQNQYEQVAQTDIALSFASQPEYQLLPSAAPSPDAFTFDQLHQEQAYQDQFANILNQNFTRDIFQTGYGDAIQSRDIYSGGVVTQMPTPAEFTSTQNVDQQGNYYSSQMMDLGMVSPGNFEVSNSAASNTGSDNHNGLLQYQWDGIQDADPSQVQQAPGNSNYFIDKIDFVNDNEDQIVIELNPNHGEPQISSSMNELEPSVSGYTGSNYATVEVQTEASLATQTPLTAQLKLSIAPHVDEDHDEDVERHLSYPAGSTEQTKALGSSRFMKQFHQQITVIKSAHGPIICKPLTPPAKSNEARKSKGGGKMSQPQRRHIKRDETQVSVMPDIIEMDLSKLQGSGSFSFGCDAWTLSFEHHPKFKRFFFEGKLKNMTEEILMFCLGEDLSLYTLTGSSYIQREISKIHQPVQKISGLKSPVPEILRLSIVAFFENFIPREKLPPKFDHEKMVRGFISKICSRHNERKSKRNGHSSKPIII